MRNIRIGIIGVGRIGRLHAENLVKRVPGVEVVAVADLRGEVANACAKELRIPKAFTDPTLIFKDSTIDAVIICTNAQTHPELIMKAAEAGKHIFCEKPIGSELEAIDLALAAVAQAGVKLQVGFNRRFDPSFSRVRELVAAGIIGRPYFVRITSRDPFPPSIDYIKVSGGIFLDMTIHDFDMARFIMNEEVIEIYAIGDVLIDKRIKEVGDIDTAIIILRFASGALGVIENSRQAVYGYDQRVEVLGERGMVRVENPRENQTILSTEKGDEVPPLLHFFVERYTDSYVRELSAFVQAVREGKDPTVTGQDGRIAVIMGYAAKRSLEEGRPVRLSEIEPSLA